jgi:hypothetical protein
MRTPSSSPHVPAAKPIFKGAGVTKSDEGFVMLNSPMTCMGFVEACRALRFWKRESREEVR